MITPKEVTGLDIAFGPRDINDFMPDYESIPEEFKRGNTQWNKLFTKMFYCGGKFKTLNAKQGIDKNKAFGHIRTIMVSFAPKHEHKEASCAYLFSLWFEEDFIFEEDTPEWKKKIQEEFNKRGIK